MPIAGFERDLGQSTQGNTKKPKSFWTDQISTGGGIAGALGGAAAGTAILPGIGTVLGGILGGALGSGAGQVAENSVTGDALLKDVGQEALLGGVLSAPPIRAGKAILGAGKALATGAGKAGAKTAAESALTKPGLISRSLGKAGQSLGGVTDDFAVKQFRLTPSQTGNFRKKFGEDAGKVINRYGFSSAEDISVKGIQPLQNQFSTLTENIGKISTNEIRDAFDKKIAALAKSASTDKKALAQQLGAERDSVLSAVGNAGSIDAVTLNNIRREFDSLVNYTEKAANPSRYGVNKRSADAIREVLQKSDPTGTLKGVGQEISKLNQLYEIVSKQSELGRGSLPASLTGLLGANIGGGAGGPLGAAIGFAGTKAINSQAGRAVLNNATEGAAGALSKAGTRSITPMSMALGSAGRIGTVGLLSGVANQTGTQQPISTQSSDISSPMNTMSTMSSANNMGSLYNQPQEVSNPYPRENLLYDIQRDPANADQYIAYYQQIQEVFGPQQAPALSQSNQSALASADNATNTLNQLEQLYTQAGGAKGRVGGFVQGLTAGAGLDSNAQAYNSLSQASVTQIAKALAGSGAGTVSDADARVIIAALPTLGDTPEEAQIKFDALRQRLEAARQNTLYYGQGQGGGTDLTSALLQAQGGY